MSARAARLGFFACAATFVVESALSATQRWLFERAAASTSGSFRFVEVISWGYVALAVGVVGALLAVASAPPSARIAILARVAAVLEGLGILTQLAEEAVIRSHASSSSDFAGMESRLQWLGAASVLLRLAELAVVMLAVERLGRGTGTRWVRPVVIAALVVLLARAGLYTYGLGADPHAGARPGLEWTRLAVFHGSQLAAAGVCVAGGLLVRRFASPAGADPGASSAHPDRLPPAWRAAAGGIGLYLGAVAARVGCALLGYLVLAGGSGAQDLSDLRPIREGVIMVAMLSGVATMAMLAGVWRISRVPVETGASGPALLALGFMVMGWALDIVSTVITADALGGHLSAAFFAMDALPVLGFVSVLLGVGAGTALLVSFRQMAGAIGHAELASRARAATLLLAVAGGAMSLALLVLKQAPTELLLGLALVALPVALAAAVQFLRVAVPLRSAIRARLPG
ncbi:MAG: hypothetical protein ACRELB_04645 [Polyangiaceae bacterium]